MARSAVNDGMRALEGLLARFFNDSIEPTIDSTGSANAYVFAANRTLSAYYDGLRISFHASFANTAAATLNVDAVGAKTIKKNHDADLASGDIEANQVVDVVYSLTDDTWQMISQPGLAFFDAASQLDFIGGLTLSNNGADAAHDIDIAAGEARDAANAERITLTAFTKQIDATWATGTAAGGLSSSLTAPANNTLYYVHAIIVGGAADVGIDTSETAANLVTDHSATAYRKIGFVVTDGSANIIAFTQSGDYFRFTGDVIADVADATITNVTFEAATLSVPPNSIAHIYGYTTNTTAGYGAGGVYIKTNGAADVASGIEGFAYQGSNGTFDYVGGIGMVLVDSSSQIQYAADEASGAATVNIGTLGCWMPTRSNP